MDKKRYSNTFILGFKNKYTESPVGFHPVYIKQKRVQCTSKSGNSVNTGAASPATKGKGKGKWDDLEKIRAFTNSENSFIQSTRNRSESEVLLGEIRSLLNKITDKTFRSIIDQLGNIDYSVLGDDMISQVVKIFLSKAIVDKEYGKLYSDIGKLFNDKFKLFENLLTGECIGVFKKLFDEPSDIQKSKCLGLMRIVPHFNDKNIVEYTSIEEKVLLRICETIDERKNVDGSYAQIAVRGGCGVYIELLCKFCEHSKNTNTPVKKYIDVLENLKTVKTIPARVRFMIEDTLDLF